MQTNGFKRDKFNFRKEIGKKIFTNWVVEEWNELSKHVVSANTVYVIRKKLYAYMDEDDDEC